MEIYYESIIDYDNIIDIRPSFAYNLYHINGSINIPKMTLLQEPSKYLNYNNTYYLICDSGINSNRCANILNALGYHCFSIKGGIKYIKNKM